MAHAHTNMFVTFYFLHIPLQTNRHTIIFAMFSIKPEIYMFLVKYWELLVT